MTPRIYLSPSSQPDNTYAGLDTNEQEVCRAIARELKNDLLRCGFEVICGDYGTMYDRVRESNGWPAGLHLPIHTNGFDGEVAGTRIMSYDLKGSGYKVCQAIFKHLAPLTPGTSENITAHPEKYEIYAAVAPTAYVEVDFHDVPDVAIWLTQNKPQIAQAICQGICDYYKMAYIPDSSEEYAPDPEPAPEPAPTPKPSGKIEGLPVVKSGSRGDAAKIVQGALIAKGYSCGSSGIDGVFGTASVAALKSYQKAQGITADGIVGPATWGKLLEV